MNEFRLKRSENKVTLRHVTNEFKLQHVGRRGPQGPEGPEGPAASNLVTSVNGRQGVVVGLAEKPYVDAELAEKADISSLSTVATSGDYNDLTNKPTLGSAASADINAFATAAQGNKADNAVQSVQEGENIVVDTTDPNNPVISSVQPVLENYGDEGAGVYAGESDGVHKFRIINSPDGSISIVDNPLGQLDFSVASFVEENSDPHSRSVSKTVAPDGTKADYNTNGASDQTTINAALAAVSATGGGTVLLRAGTYTTSAVINVPDNVSLIGENDTVTINCSVALPGYTISLGSNSTLENIKVVTTGRGVNILNESNTNIRNCNLDAQGFVIFLNANSTNVTSRIIIEGNRLLGHGQNDVIGGGPTNSTTSDVTDVIIHNNYIDQDCTVNTYQNAFDIVASKRLIFTNNNVRGIIEPGFEQYPHNGIIISNNHVRPAIGQTTTRILVDVYSVSLSSGKNLIISGNVVYNGDITVEGHSTFKFLNTSITNNVIETTSITNGISLKNCSYGTVTGNLINGAGSGVKFELSDNFDVTANTFVNCVTPINDISSIATIRIGTNTYTGSTNKNVGGGPATAQELAFYNTVDQTTNFERILMRWNANVFQMLFGSGGTGLGRQFQLGTVADQMVIESGALYKFTIGQTTRITGNNIVQVSGTLNSPSAEQIALGVRPTYNQSGTGSGVDLLIDRTETAVGSGQQLLFDARVGGVSKARISTLGYIYAPRHYFNSTAYIDGATAGAAILTGNMGINDTPTTEAIRIKQTANGNANGFVLTSTGGVAARLWVDGNGVGLNNGSSGNANINLNGNGTGFVGINTTAPTHSLTLSSTSTGIALYNTADQATNYERARLYWNSNVLSIATDAGGTGIVRPLQISAAGNTILLQGVTSAVSFSRVATGLASIWNFNTSFTGTNLIQKGLSVDLTTTQAGTAGYTAHLVNVTETTVGSGTKLLADFQVGGSSKASIRNDGRITSVTEIVGTRFRSSNGGGLVNDASDNNASVLVQTTGVVLFRNIADSTAAVYIENRHASSTGDIVRFNNSAGTVFRVKQAGTLNMTTTSAPGTPADGDIWFDGTNLKMRVAGASRSLAMLSATPGTYAASNVTTDRTFDANSTTLDELADVVGTLIADLRAIGVVL